MEYCRDTHKSCFSFLSEASAKILCTSLVRKTCKAGDDLSSYFCFVISGELDVRRDVQSGGISRSHLLARIGAGSFVGEGALVGSGSSFCSVVCVKDCVVAVLEADGFEEFLGADPVAGNLLMKNIMSVIHQRLGNASARLVHVL